MDGAAEDDRYSLQNVEQPVRVLEDDFVTRNKIVKLRRLEAVDSAYVQERLHELVDQSERHVTTRCLRHAPSLPAPVFLSCRTTCPRPVSMPADETLRPCRPDCLEEAHRGWLGDVGVLLPAMSPRCRRLASS